MITTATAPADSVIGVVNLPGSMKSLSPESSIDEGGVFELREAHASSQHPRATRRNPLRASPAPARIAPCHQSPKRLLVAVNPAASFGRNRGVGAAVVERLLAEGYEVSMLREANFELLRREAESAFAQGTDGLVVVGGDGMASLGVNLVAQTDIPLGIVAAGTGNDLARGLGLPYDDPAAGPRRPGRSRSARPPRRIDAGLIRHGERFARGSPAWSRRASTRSSTSARIG